MPSLDRKFYEKLEGVFDFTTGLLGFTAPIWLLLAIWTYDWRWAASWLVLIIMSMILQVFTKSELGETS